MTIDLLGFVRDKFTEKIKRTLDTRAGHLCSNPDCRRPTAGPGLEPHSTVNIGVAAHITAASPGTPDKPGPRYDKSLTAKQRSDISNGIWLCQICAKLVDSDIPRFPADLLRKWKKDAEDRAFLAIATSGLLQNQRSVVFAQLDEADREFLCSLKLAQNEDIETVIQGMRRAAENDIAAFRGTRDWPAHVIDLNLVLNTNGKRNAISLKEIANAIGVVETLNLVSPPGTGKTTTITQLADEIINAGQAVPALIPLGEWSATKESFFSFLIRRNAFGSFREQHFQQLAFYGSLVLLIDGWNEVDADSRIHAMRQLSALHRDFPLLGVVIGTRRQAVPTSGPIVEIDLLNEDQQLELARRFSGGNREAILDQAWRTPGINELIATPLYFNALLSSTQDGSFPQTKEQVLSAFVAQHESTPEKAEVLRKELLGFHKDMLVGLAVEANKLAIVTLSDANARVAISKVGARLISEGQITVTPQPSAVLDVLVNTHTLVRSPSETGSLSFQHQQFQEWYASFEVERLMLKAAQNDADAKKALRTDILNWIAWEESILFACERLSRKDVNGAQAVAAAILETLGIDPMLAAEMIYRASEPVWTQIKDAVVGFASRWHQSGRVDRAVRFMITTGRPEFAPQVWPLVAISDNQVYLNTLRKPRRFRPSVLGPDAAKRLGELPDDIRGDIVAAIVHESGFDGLELATEIAKNDPKAEVVVDIILALEFRQADRHVSEILETAAEGVWKQITAADFPIRLNKPSHKARLAKLKPVQDSDGSDPIRNLIRLANHMPHDERNGEQIAKMIEAEQFPAKSEPGAFAIKRACDSYPSHTKTALLKRIQSGLPVPYGTDELLKDLPVIDDGPLADAAMDKATPEALARIAFTVIGPETVGRIMDQLFILNDKVQTEGQHLDEMTRKEYWRLKDGIAASPQTSFVEALLKRAKSDKPHQIQLMADLLSRHGKGETQALALSDELRGSLTETVQYWIDFMLTSPEANRHQIADVAYAVARLPQPRFLEGLHRMLERDLNDWTRAQEDFKKSRPRGPIMPDVACSYALQYRRAFVVIGGADVIALMKLYLPDLRFGIDAACVLSALWHKENIPVKERRLGTWHDFSDVKGKRMLQQDEQNPPSSSDSAEAIFAVVREMGTNKSDSASQRHAIQLATVGLRMAHGSKRSEIDSLLALQLPYAAKRELLTAAAEAGEVIRIKDLVQGIQELLETAKKEPWRLDNKTGELMGWLVLFAFCDQPAALIGILDTVPDRHCEPWDMDRLLIALGDSPHEDALQVLKALADRDKRILDNYHWTNSVFKLGTEAAARLIIDFICDGKLPNRHGFSTKQLADLAIRYPSISAELLQRYAAMPLGNPRAVLESILLELTDAEIVLALVRSYARHKKMYDGNIAHAIRETAVGKRPVAEWPNAYHQFSVSLTDLRKELFAMVLANNADSTLAAACLNEIEELRDEHGRVNDEPRHPNIDSGNAWPKEATIC